MSGTDRTPFLKQPNGSPYIDGDGGHICAVTWISFEQSIEAYDLAVQSNALYSFEDLLLSGTWYKYEQRAASMARKHPSRDPFISYLAIDTYDGWKSSNSRQSYRSALTRMAAKEILESIPIYWRQMITDEKNEGNQRKLIRCLKPHIDEDALNRMRDAPEPLSDDQQRRLSGAIVFLLEVPPDPHHTALRDRRAKKDKEEEREASRASASKKDALYALNRHQRRKAKTCPSYDWRSHFWTTAVVPDPHLDNYRRACIATLILTGCRPSEFSNNLGISVHIKDTDGQPCLRFEIAGAKVSDKIDVHPGKGQYWRRIDMLCQTAEAIWLFDHISNLNQGSIFLKLSTATHKQTGEMLMPIERRRRVSVTLGKLITRLGKVAFPRLQHRLTPYVFRHAFTSDFKTEGHDMDTSELAAGLGHQSSRTQEHYGSANTARGLGGSRALQITEVISSTPVRQPPRQGHPTALHTRAQPKN